MTTLESIAHTYERNLKNGSTTSFAIDGLDRLGVPVEFAFHRLQGGAKLDGYGYGHTWDEARVGASGELAEAVHNHLWMETCRRMHASYIDMVNRYGPRGVVDPIALSLPAGSWYTPDIPLSWVAAKRWPSRETVYVPLEVAASAPRYMQGVKPLFTPNTNGRGAGLCIEQALAHGVLELLQRDGNCTAFRALDQGRCIDLDVIQDASIRDLLHLLEKADIEVTVKLACTDFGLVNLYVVGRDHGAAAFPLMLTACGEAAHPDREFALRKALLEFAAARCRKAFMHGSLADVERVTPAGYMAAAREDVNLENEEPRSLREMAMWCTHSAAALYDLVRPTVFKDRARVPFSSLETAPAALMQDPVARLSLVAERLLSAGHDILYVDYTPADSDVAVVKAIVTGLECETMSYYRLGERGARRLLVRGDDFIGRGNAPSGCLPVMLTPESEERLGSIIWLDPARVDAIVGGLYPLYREPTTHAVQRYLANQGSGG